jgi:hypothetical protein
MSVTAPIDLTRAQLPETTIDWYRSVTRNRFVQCVLPAIQWTVNSSQDVVSDLTDDERRSEQLFYTTVQNMMPSPDLGLSERCMRSYEINAFTMFFAFAMGLNRAYGRFPAVVDVTAAQAMAMHQANGLCDALVYLLPAMSEEVVMSWFALLYQHLICLFQSRFCSRSVVFFLFVAIVCDLFHHTIHWVACCWRFGLVDRQFGVLAKKTEYHLYHWGALLVMGPNIFLTRDAWLNTICCRLWTRSHYAELQSHVRNPSCCSKP